MTHAYDTGMPATITLLLYVIAVARAVQLVIDDKITQRVRDAWARNTHPDGLPRYLVTCAKCVSMWLAPALAAAYVLAPEHPIPRIAAAALAFSWLAVLLRDLHRLLEAKVRLYTPAQPERELEGADGP